MEARLGTVLIVDDEALDQKMYKRVIERSGLAANVLTFNYPDEALAYLGEAGRDAVDVLLIDVNMPRMSGYEFLSRAELELEQQFAELTVAILTTVQDPLEEGRAREMPKVDHVLCKPLTIEDLQLIASTRSAGLG